ncbi:MAG: HdeD family acid-resistance protein [Luteolibacter sp.]
MANLTSTDSEIRALSASRGWLIIGGILSIVVGFIAMGSPYLFSVLIAQYLGIATLVIGVISLFMAIVGKHNGHRVAEAFSGVIRIAAGIVLLRCIGSSVAIITLIFAGYLAAQGFIAILGAFKLRGNAGWIWTLINGVASLILALLVFSRWPGDSASILGLLFGIHTLFSGVSLLMLGLGSRKQVAG